MKATLFFGLLFSAFCLTAAAQPSWQANLDSKIRFYQTTDFGIVLADTEKSLYAIDGQTGERIWRRETGRINETGVTPIPGTDLVLVTRDLGDKSRLEAVDILSGAQIWQSDKEKGDVMQLALIVALGLATLLIWPSLGIPALVPCLLVTAAATFLVTRRVRQRLSGHTGDTIGATQQICEIASLCTLAMCI